MIFFLYISYSPKLSPEVGAQEMKEKSEDKTISTPSAATSTTNQEHSTTELDSTTRHKQAVLVNKDSSKDSISSVNIDTKTISTHRSESSGNNVENKVTFAMPALPSSKNPKPKQKKASPPDSSLSKVLEGLKSGSRSEKDAWKEVRFKKPHPVKEQSEGSQVIKPMKGGGYFRIFTSWWVHAAKQSNHTSLSGFQGIKNHSLSLFGTVCNLFYKVTWNRVFSYLK